ncbi:MAG: HAMP domain-containing histidine kinase, partial [Thermoguttaceae bacterium]|nr:HAMP domain-containing histidine kinase [Thermoguttaceae bacterium]
TRISDLVLDMLTFSKERVPVMEFADINRVVSDVVELMQGRCTDGDVQLTWYPDETVPSFFFDPEQINRAIMNIVTNAIDAARDRVENEVDDAGEGSPETKGVVEVRTRYDDRSRTVQVLVDDNGSGVAPELKDILFRPFLSKNKSGGTGLGLAVTNKIIQEHQGRVDIDDSPLGGARFTVELPVLEKKPEES